MTADLTQRRFNYFSIGCAGAWDWKQVFNGTLWLGAECLSRAKPSHSNQQFPVSFDDRLLIVKQAKAVEDTLAVITGLSYPECWFPGSAKQHSMSDKHLMYVIFIGKV
jgi:hypothetical protein